MDINVLVSKIRRKGYNQSQAEIVARQLSEVAKSYGVNPYELVNELSDTFELNDVGSFIMDNTRVQGYLTGRMKKTKPNRYVARAIFK